MNTETEARADAARAVLRCLLFAVLLTLITPLYAGAAKPGWTVKNGKVFYYRYVKESSLRDETEIPLMEESEKAGEDRMVLAKATGLTVIEGKTFYFNEKGVLQTGWVRLADGMRYFSPEGEAGTLGSMVTGLKTIDSALYYLKPSTGCAAAGKKTIDGNTYYFQKQENVYGQAVCNTWVKIKGKFYFFGKKGTLIKNCWIGRTYFVDGEGARVTGWLKSGNYRYYMDAKGVKQTGLTQIGGKKYYFDANGRLLANTTVDGYRVDAFGVATKMASVLIIAGHGQGDVGAMSKWGYEYKYTREFARLIYDRLVKNGKLSVTFYKDGSEKYDCYQQNKKVLSVGGANIASQITGKGSARSKVLAAIRNKSNIPAYRDYDYVLEVHFNATGYSDKDVNGNGSYKGIGFYINSYKSKYAMEKDILSRVVRLGFRQWGSGVFGSSTLFNARICQELGVNYGLLETAFLDDGDDMKFYRKNRKKMAAAVAAGLEAGLLQ